MEISKAMEGGYSPLVPGPIWIYVSDDDLKTVLYNETKITEKSEKGS